MPSPANTKERILDTAERLFAERGFAPTSLRNITAAAEVNLAAVNYHFGSKEALIEAVFARRLAPINRERLARLERLEAAKRMPRVEEIVEAFVEPPLRLSRSWRPGGVVMRMLGQAMTQPDVRTIFIGQFRGVFRRFTSALARALPQLPEPETLWRFLFMVGSMAYTMTMSEELADMSGRRCGASDTESVLRRLVPFIVAGLQAPGPAITPRDS